MSNKIEISLTDFMNFITNTGSTKLNVVKHIKGRGGYLPQLDFYKKLREGIINIHKNNRPKKNLDAIVNGLTDDKKKANYPQMIRKYKAFWGRKKLDWFAPPRKIWTQGSINMRVNPELGLEINNKQFLVIKMYLNQKALAKKNANTILAIMEKELRSEVEDEIEFVVLDVKKNRLHMNDKTKTSKLLPLILGELINFETIYKNL